MNKRNGENTGGLDVAFKFNDEEKRRGGRWLSAFTFDVPGPQARVLRSKHRTEAQPSATIVDDAGFGFAANENEPTLAPRRCEKTGRHCAAEHGSAGSAEAGGGDGGATGKTVVGR